MALVSPLVPWPTDPTHAGNALECVHLFVGQHIDMDVLLMTARAAAEMIEDHAPSAKQFVKDNALMRLVAFLVEHPSAGIRSESTGDIRTAYSTNEYSPLRHSGAMALLAPYRVRRAGKV